MPVRAGKESEESRMSEGDGWTTQVGRAEVVEMASSPRLRLKTNDEAQLSSKLPSIRDDCFGWTSNRYIRVV